MHDQVGAVEGGGEELLVALELQFVRHHVTAFASMPSADTMT